MTIDDCAELSKHISLELERNNIIKGSYLLNVTSPGLDMPLAVPRQYLKNIGRKVKTTLADGNVIKGTLSGFDEKSKEVIIETGDSQEKVQRIEMDTIKWTKVQVLFK